MVRFIEDTSNRAELIKLHLTNAPCQQDSENAPDLDESYSSSYSLSNPSEHSIASDTDQECSTPRWQRERENDIKNVSEFIRKEFKSNSNLKSENNGCYEFDSQSIRNTLDLSTSNTPLHDFSIEQINYNSYNSNMFQNEDKVRLDDAEKFQSLLDHYDRKVLCPLDILNKSEEYQDISRLEENSPSDFMLFPLENPACKENFTSGHDKVTYGKFTTHAKVEANSDESKINQTKTILSSSESRLPVPQANSNSNGKELFLNRKYWMCHPSSHLDKSFSYLNMLGEDGVPKSIHKGFFRYVHKLLVCLKPV